MNPLNAPPGSHPPAPESGEPEATHGGQREMTPRRQYRLPKNYVVEVRQITLPHSAPYDIISRTNDISVGGINITSPRPLPMGDMVQMRLTIPLLNRYGSTFLKPHENDMEQYMKALARVAWVKPAQDSFSIGLMFEDVSDVTRDALHALITEARRQMERREGA